MSREHRKVVRDHLIVDVLMIKVWIDEGRVLKIQYDTIRTFLTE